MFQKAGHIRRKRNGATDEYGNRHEVLTLFIEGQTYALRINDMKQALHGSFSANFERIKFHWQDYLEGAVGTVYLSRSGKAVILEFFTGRRYCIPVTEIRAVISGVSGHAVISSIPAVETSNPVSPHAGTVQTILSAF